MHPSLFTSFSEQLQNIDFTIKNRAGKKYCKKMFSI